MTDFPRINPGQPRRPSSPNQPVTKRNPKQHSASRWTFYESLGEEAALDAIEPRMTSPPALNSSRPLH